MSLPRLDPMQELLLVGQARGGDTAAFSVLVRAYERRLLFFLRRFAPDAARALDLLQEVWLDAFRKLPALRTPEAFRVWLYRIAHDRGVTQVRRDRREDEALAETEPAGDVLDHHEFERAEIAHLVREALDELPPGQRTVLTLRFLEEMNLEDLSGVLGVPVGTVKSRLHHAKLALRERLKERGHDDI